MQYNLYLFSHPRATFKIRRTSVVFPEDFGCNLTYYESEKFSDSILRHISQLISKSENFKYPNLGSFIWGMKCEIQKAVGNLLDKPRKLFIN